MRLLILFFLNVSNSTNLINQAIPNNYNHFLFINTSYLPINIIFILFNFLI